MKLGTILLLAFGLSMDAMAVAAARGLAVRKIEVRHVALVAGFFGGFQALMPLFGWLVGKSVGSLLAAWQGWVICAVLGAIGGKMLWEALHHDRDHDDEPAEANPFGLRVMTMLAIATSIDALAAGFTLPLMGAPLGVSVLVIGVTTATLSGLGLLLGHRFGAALGRRLDALGGLVLIGLGLKALLEQLSR